MVVPLKRFLKSQGWKVSELEERGLFLFGIEGKNGQFQCVAELNQEQNSFIFHSLYGNTIPQAKITTTLQVINNLNGKIRYGNFILDEEEGEIRLKTSIFLDAIEPTEQLYRNTIMPNIMIMDDLLALFTSLVTEDFDFQSALDKVSAIIEKSAE